MTEDKNIEGLQSFNLVIENLIFSSGHKYPTSLKATLEFQSRNRESYLFKWGKWTSAHAADWRFNLVIENLIFSSRSWVSIPLWHRHPCFNLVIENLIFSRKRCWDVTETQEICFNLVIENLIFSSVFAGVGAFLVIPSFNLVIENLIFSRNKNPISYRIPSGVSIS